MQNEGGVKSNFAAAAAIAAMATLAKDVVRVSEFGFDDEDSTRFLQAAIDSGAKKVVVDARRWIVQPLRGRSDQEIFFEDGTVVEAKKGAYLGKDDCVFAFPGCSNVVIGGKGAIRMHHDDYLKPPYRESEWRHAITILGTHNAKVWGLKILNAGGDGIYVGALKKHRAKAFGIARSVCASTGIRIEDVYVDTSVRQGISITSVDGLIVETLKFDAPGAGFYFLDSRRIGLLLSLLECDAPIAVDLTSDWCAAIASQGELYFSVPENAPEFGFFVSGDGSESIGVELVSPTSRSVYNCPSVFAWKGHVEQTGGEAGLWKAVFKKAEKGCFGDWMFDLTGIAGHVFLSPEKFWSFNFPMSSHPAVAWAHDEFTNHATKVFGTAPPVSFRLPSKDGQFAADWKRLEGTDGYAVRWMYGVLNIVAANPKGLVKGVHKWLERHTDIVWPRPGGDLCLYTKRPAPAGWKGLQDEYVDIPAFLRRTLGSGSKSPEVWRYRVRNGDTSLHDRGTRLEHRDLAMRYGMIGCHMDYWGGGRGHNMGKIWFPKTECPDHPEYRMLIDGKRWMGGKMNFCESNPDFIQAFCDSVERKMPSVPPDIKLINITIEDRVLTCQCDGCQKPIRLDDGTFLESSDPAYRSTRFFRFYNQVARRVAAVRPGANVIVHGYYHLTEAPRIKVEKNIIVRFCPYPRNMRESVVEGPSNRRWRKKLDGWLASGAEIGLREYYWCGNIFFPRPMADTAVIDLRYFLEKGGKYVYSPVVESDDGQMSGIRGIMRPRSEFYNPLRMALIYIVQNGIADKCREALKAALAKADCEVRRKWIASMQGILEMWIAESPKYRQVETRVRFTGTPIKPHFDMSNGKP